MSHQGPPFAFHLRRDDPYTHAVTVRFEVLDGGMGVLGLRTPGRVDPPPSLHGEETGIEADALRAGRFIHVVTGGSRQSYALSRLTEEVVASLPDDRWILLDLHTEYGFRYLVAPADLSSAAPPEASVQLQPVRQSAVAESIGAMAALLKVPRPASVASAAASGTPTALPAAAQMPDSTLSPNASSTEVAERQVPVAPALAESVLASLDLDQARAYLKAEMAKVEALHAHAGRLERELAASRAREVDLLDVLRKWQSR